MDPDPGDGRLDETRSFKVLSPGAMISHYKIVEKIGAGGMGVVYKAEDTRLKRHVALKFLPPHLTQDPEAKSRFVHEAQSASAIEHSNICTIHQIDETEDGQIFISMACYEGETLRTRLERGPLPVDDALDIAAQVAEGLKEAHRKDIVHRDIKPANLIITPQGQVKIMDFGLAKLASQTRLTRPGTAMGTVAYMSPEQARGEDVDQRSDIWALGVVIYEMLTGRMPFKGDYEQARIYSILNEEPERIGAIRQDVPDDLEQIVTKALQKDTKERYESSDALVADLQQLQAGVRVHISLPERRPLRRRLTLIAAAAVVVVAAIVLWPRLTQWFGPTRMTATTLAVVDFDNISGEEAGHLAVGIAEGICVKLSKVAGIRVVSSDDIRRLRKDDLTAKEIALRLGADYAVGGSLLKSDEKIRVTPQLIEASTGTVVWTQFFDREFNDVFRFMDEVSLKIVDALKIRFTQEDRLAIRERPTDSPEAYDHYLRGRHHFHSETVVDNELAAKEFRKALQIDPEYPRALAGLADAYVQRYRERYDYDEYWLDQADSLINRALGFESDRAEAYKSHAAVLLEKENLLGALEAAEKARDLRPDWDEPYVQLGVIYQTRGEARLALEMYERALAIRPSVRAWCGKGNVFGTRGELDSAETIYREAIDLNPDHERPYWELARLYADDMDRLEDSERMFRKAIEVRPDRGRSYEDLMWLLVVLPSPPYEEAEALLRSFVDEYPYNWDAYEALYRFLAWEMGDYAGALEVVDQAIANNPDRFWPHLLLAQTYAYQMAPEFRKGDAVRSVDRALKLRPNSSRVLRWAGDVYAELDSSEKALDYYRLGLEINPGSASILTSMGALLLQVGKYDSAAVIATKAIEQTPGIPGRSRWQSNYALLRAAMTHQERTEEYLNILADAAGKYGDDDPQFWADLGREQCMAGQFQKAISSYRRCLNKRNDGFWWMGLGMAQWLSGDTEAALGSFLEARDTEYWLASYPHEMRIVSLMKYLGRFDEIELRLENIRSTNVGLWALLAVDYFASMRRFDDAIEVYAEIKERGDEITWKEWSALARAEFHRRKGDFGKAKRIIDEAYSGPAASAQVRGGAYRELARIAAMEGDLPRAVKLAEDAVEISPRSGSDELLGELQLATGQAEKALATLTSAGGLPSSTRLYRIGQFEEIAATSQTMPHFRKALLLATRLARNEHGSVNLAEARCFCALAAARLGDSARARAEIAHALKLEPERADIAYLAAAAYSLSGETEQALDWLKIAVERGHQDFWWARVDPDLDPLRDLPRFKQIMADWDTRMRSIPN